MAFVTVGAGLNLPHNVFWRTCLSLTFAIEIDVKSFAYNIVSTCMENKQYLGEYKHFPRDPEQYIGQKISKSGIPMYIWIIFDDD